MKDSSLHRLAFALGLTSTDPDLFQLSLVIAHIIQNCLQWGRSNLVAPAEWPRIGLLKEHVVDCPRKTAKHRFWEQKAGLSEAPKHCEICVKFSVFTPFLA